MSTRVTTTRVKATSGVKAAAGARRPAATAGGASAVDASGPKTAAAGARSKRAKKEPGTAGAAPSKATPSAKKKAPGGAAAAARPRLPAARAPNNKQVRERIARAFAHRLYLIDHAAERSADGATWTLCRFNVLGATGNVYEVTVGPAPRCTCPDHTVRGNTCKHQLFVMLRVLGLSSDDPVVFRKALSPAEVARALARLAAAGGGSAVLASEAVRAQFQQLAEGGGGGGAAGGAGATAAAQRPLDGACPICFEALSGEGATAPQPVVFCHTCGNSVHAECFQRWRAAKGRAAVEVTCVYCRATWRDQAAAEKGPGGGGGGSTGGSPWAGYLNLAQFSDAHQAGDTSLESLYPESHMWMRGGGGSRGKGRRR